MRATTGGELTLLHNPKRSEGAKVEIVRKSNGAAVDITDRVRSVSINFSADNRVATIDAELDDLFPRYGATSALQPLVSGSSYNSPDRLLWPDNEIKVYFGVNTLGTAVGTSERKLIFHGVLGDSIGPSSTPGKRGISIHARDLAARLQRAWIRGERIYGDEGGTAAVAVIQAILNDNFTSDTSSDDYKKLHVKVALDGNNNIDGCDFVVYPTIVGNMSVWDAINQIIGCTAADDIGYELRYSFLPNGDTSTKDNEGETITVSGDGFYLTLLAIDQSDVSDDDTVTAGTDVIHEHSVEIYDDTIRNDIDGVYRDRDTGELMTINRQDEDSIAAYGRRKATIGQADVPWIDTHDEMWPLLGVAINALKDVPVSDAFTTQLMYHIDPNDLIGTTNARLATGSQSVGITSITHSIAPGGSTKTKQKCTTTFTGFHDRRVGNRSQHLNYGGENSMEQVVPPDLGFKESSSHYLNNGNVDSTITILRLEPLPEWQVEHYEWIFALEGSGQWERVITTEPELRLVGYPPATKIAWNVRAKVSK